MQYIINIRKRKSYQTPYQNKILSNAREGIIFGVYSKREEKSSIKKYQLKINRKFKLIFNKERIKRNTQCRKSINSNMRDCDVLFSLKIRVTFNYVMLPV